MPKFVLIIVFFIQCICLPLNGASRNNVSGLEFSEDGLPIIRVTLHSLTIPDKSIECRFLLSTAFDVTIIDTSVPPEFFRHDPGTFEYLDATGSTHGYPRVLLKQVEVSSLRRESIAGGRVDLKTTMGQMLDEPVDGILGMSFLRGTRFIYDSAARRVQWWPDSFQGMALPLSYGPNHTPFVNIKINNQNIAAILDLTMVGGLDLPWTLKPPQTGAVRHNQAMVGGSAKGQRITLDQVDAGSGCWTHIPCYFQEGMEWASIGQDVWSAAPVCFDFIQDRLTLKLDEARKLPLQAKGHLGIPVFWDRAAAPHRLTVVAVPPDTAMARAGCRPGDRVVSAGGLSGVSLNRRSLMALLAAQKQHFWTVLRGGKSEQLLFFAEPATAPAQSQLTP